VERALEAARASGLIAPGEPLLVLLSGGADSVCLLDCAMRLEADVRALHVNYGLRPGAPADEEYCRALCSRLGVELTVERVELSEDDPGNLQAHARELRYAAAERLAEGDYAAAHTASDQAETVLYRLAGSPGGRALLGMAPRRGRLVRPLLEVTRDDTHEYCEQRDLIWREDPTNIDRRFARTRIRHDVLPVLRSLNDQAERTISETSMLLRDERAALDKVADEALERAGGAALSLEELRSTQPGLARVMLTRLAERAAHGTVALSRADCDAIMSLSGAGTQYLDLGDGVRAVAEYGTLRFVRGEAAGPPDAIQLTIPGTAGFGDWQVEAQVVKLGRAAGGGYLPARGDALLSQEKLGDRVTIRAWQDGDKMRPAGLDGTKSLQDLFTDQKVPRALRGSLPIIEVNGEIAWVAGLAIGEAFRAGADEDVVVALSARQRA
jgi:tRNA(Ile)-lysidine synthase